MALSRNNESRLPLLLFQRDAVICPALQREVVLAGGDRHISSLAGFAAEGHWLPSGERGSLPCIGSGADVYVAGVPADFAGSAGSGCGCRCAGGTHSHGVSAYI